MAFSSSRRMTVPLLSVTSSWNVVICIGRPGSHNLALKGSYVPIPLQMISDTFTLPSSNLKSDLNTCVYYIRIHLLCLNFTAANRCHGWSHVAIFPQLQEVVVLGKLEARLKLRNQQCRPYFSSLTISRLLPIKSKVPHPQVGQQMWTIQGFRPIEESAHSLIYLNGIEVADKIDFLFSTHK